MIVIAIALQLIFLYGTFAVAMIGFGLMIGGPSWAADAARYFLGRPFYALLRQLSTLFGRAVGGLAYLIKEVAHAFVTTFIDPIVRVLHWVLDRLFARR